MSCSRHDEGRHSLTCASDEGVTLRTPEGLKRQAGHVVMVAGYASQKWLKPSLAKNRSRYAFITEFGVSRMDR
jgi:hypothetical protein